MKITINKFKAIEGLEIQVPATITGGNGLGKSTILEAISFCFSGKNLNGNEFKQVYDNRQDLHDASANVTFFDDFGNSWQRIVSPIFQTTRQGVEEIKILRSTECRKNGIVVNDYSQDFEMFTKFGTDFFFNQKEDIQRAMFIEILKSKLPNYDIKNATLSLKELKKAQRTDVEEIESLQKMKKALKDVEVPTIDEELKTKNDEYLRLLNASNPEVVNEINRKNNELMQKFNSEKNGLNSEIVSIESAIKRDESEKNEFENDLAKIDNSKIEPKKVTDTTDLETKIKELKTKLNDIERFETIEDYAKKNLTNNPILVKNAEKIKELFVQNYDTAPAQANLGACPLSGEFCETAKIYGEKSEKMAFDNKKSEKIDALKKENRDILTREMHAANSTFDIIFNQLSSNEKELELINFSNEKIEEENASMLLNFNQKNESIKNSIKVKIKALENSIMQNEIFLDEKTNELEKLQEPEMLKLPESTRISEELKNANISFIEKEKEITGANAINQNNVKNKTKFDEEIKEKQANLFDISKKIVTLQSDITDFFSNIKKVVAQEFKADIEIGVELLEYVLSRDEYKDCFKITANGKVFPFECNGALQNNVKMLILSTFQKLVSYKGITLLDNCEANTTQPINTYETKAVIAFATMDKNLLIN